MSTVAFQLQQDVIEAYDQYQFHVINQKVHHFCAMDLGSFYLDIIKDRQYTAKGDSLARRSAQNGYVSCHGSASSLVSSDY